MFREEYQVHSAEADPYWELPDVPGKSRADLIKESLMLAKQLGMKRITLDLVDLKCSMEFVVHQGKWEKVKTTYTKGSTSPHAKSS